MRDKIKNQIAKKKQKHSKKIKSPNRNSVTNEDANDNEQYN